jgi:hypothetical protein
MNAVLFSAFFAGISSMKTTFSLGFQPHNPFSVRHPALGQNSMGQWNSVVSSVINAGVVANQAAETEAARVAAAEAEKRAQLQAVITKGNTRLAQVRSWSETQYAKDPTLLSTFKQQHIVNNWNGYEELVRKDQYYADLASKKISSLDPINWEFSEELLSRVVEWNQVIDIMYAGMVEYGGATASIKLGPSPTGVTGAPVQTRIAPNATISTPPPSDGISTKTLLIGAGVTAAVIGLIFALKA